MRTTIRWEKTTMPASRPSVDVPISSQDQHEILDLYARLQSADARVVGSDGAAQLAPPNLSSFLYHLLAALTAGKSVTILQSNADLTTVEAARLLSVSRQFLIQLLEQGQIPFHMVGTHRRLYARDVLAYKSRRDSARRVTLDQLAEAELAEGLYDLNAEQKAPPSRRPSGKRVK